MESIPYNIPQPPDSLYVFSNLTFGTALVMNGLIRVLTRQHARVKWIVRTEYIHAVRRTISDLPGVQVLAASSDHEVQTRWIPQARQKLLLGQFDPNGYDQEKWDAEIYRGAGISFDARWNECKFPKEMLNAEPRKPIALVYETKDEPVKPDFLPSNLSIFRMLNRSSALDWLPEVLSATELHFIDSSYLTLAESLHAMGAIPGVSLIYHKYARQTPGPTLRAPWKIFE